jgi:nucleotide sugar dehydrogenase
MISELRDFYQLESDHPKVCIVGMGYVGLTLAISLCNAGFEVVGIESNRQLALSLNEGKTNIFEPNLEESFNLSLSSQALRIVYSGEIKEELVDARIFILTVGTPIIDRRIDTSNILRAVETIKPFLRDLSLIVTRSTVSVGTTRKVIFEPLIAQGYNVLVSMCPERTVEGNALNEIRDLPQIVGGVNDLSAAISRLFFSQISREVIVVENSESAELVKLVNNTYRDLMFGFANEIAAITSSFGLSARKIISAANNNYSRSAIALPGPSGGPCLEKDPWILFESAASNGVLANITKSARELNENLVIQFLESCLNSEKKITKATILGLAFKGRPKTRDTRGSFSREVCKLLVAKGVNKIVGYEPAGKVFDLDAHLEESTELMSSCEDSELIIILTNSPSFNDIEGLLSSSVKSDALIVDFWGTLRRELLRRDIQLRTWG